MTPHDELMSLGIYFRHYLCQYVDEFKPNDGAAAEKKINELLILMTKFVEVREV